MTNPNNNPIKRYRSPNDIGQVVVEGIFDAMVSEQVEPATKPDAELTKDEVSPDNLQGQQ